ncbi:MAG: hypothetical protein DRP85_03180 [Candidatus Makaraimicrobium thalassicum]|nr:MAG: hypothetical protein DRP85_03180 [Candidatus Omnitrophota bacterium]
MSKTDIALSWSRLSNYRQCPDQFAAKYIRKDYPDEGDNPAFVKGTKIHTQLEEYILFMKGEKKKPVMGAISRGVVPLINWYFSAYGADSIFAEQQLALDHKWKETSWFGKPKDVKFRGIIDMVIFETPEVMTVIDFKSGKFRAYDEEFGQLHMTAAYLFELYPEIQTVKSLYLFVEHKRKIEVIFERADHKKTKARFDLEYIEVNEDEEFAPKKNKFCFFCLIKEDCKYG